MALNDEIKHKVVDFGGVNMPSVPKKQSQFKLIYEALKNNFGYSIEVKNFTIKKEKYISAIVIPKYFQSQYGGSIKFTIGKYDVTIINLNEYYYSDVEDAMDASNYVTLKTDQTIDGYKVFAKNTQFGDSIEPIEVAIYNHLQLNGSLEVQGTATFKDAVEVQEPTADGNPATKKYVDDKLASSISLVSDDMTYNAIMIEHCITVQGNSTDGYPFALCFNVRCLYSDDNKQTYTKVTTVEQLKTLINLYSYQGLCSGYYISFNVDVISFGSQSFKYFQNTEIIEKDPSVILNGSINLIEDIMQTIPLSLKNN